MRIYLCLLVLLVVMQAGGCTTLDVHRRTVGESPDGTITRTDNSAEYSATNVDDLQRIWSIASPIISAGLGSLPGGGAIAAIIGTATTAAAGGWGLKRSGDAKAAVAGHQAADKSWDEATAHHLALVSDPVRPNRPVVDVASSG